MKTKALAQMGTASFCGGVRHKRYSGQQEIASQNSNINENVKIQFQFKNSISITMPNYKLVSLPLSET
jgi:hypothetical protein